MDQQNGPVSLVTKRDHQQKILVPVKLQGVSP